MAGRERTGERQGEKRTIIALVGIRKEQVYILQADATPELIGITGDVVTSVLRNRVWTK